MGDAPPQLVKSYARLKVDKLLQARSTAICTNSSSAAHWRRLEPVVLANKNGREEAKLRCTLCLQYLGTSNVSRTGTEHFKSDGTCCGLSTWAGKRRYAAMAEEGSMDAHVVHPLPATATVKALSELSLFFFTTNTPLHLVENPHLQECLKSLGVKKEDLVSRKQLSTTILDAEFESCSAKLSANLEGLNLINMSTDGWRSQSAAQGANLINCVVLPPQGGSLFYDVKDTTGHIKDGQYLADLHLDLLDEASNGNEDKQNSVVIDNTSANRSAMRIMKSVRPWLVTLGCSVSTGGNWCVQFACTWHTTMHATH